VDFAGKWKLWFTISLLIIIPGLIVIGVKGLNLGIDFTGGNLLEVQFDKNLSTGQVRSVLKQFKLEKSPIQSAEKNRFIIRTRTLTEEENRSIIQAFEKEFGKVNILRNEKVDAIIGRELTINGILALAIASVLIVLYITYRFEFNFAIAAIIALFHDVLVTLAFMAIFRLEVDSAFVAAILTIIGYSINDTIVIFDRIRENLRSPKKKDLTQLVNESVIQTMARSLNTAGTTSVTLLALILLGGETTKVFATALLVGVISGTYSSIFIASPVWALIRSRRKKGIHLQSQRA